MLHLVALAAVHGLKAAPRAVYLRRGMRLAAPSLGQRRDELLNALRLVAMGHQYTVRGFHHDQVFNAKCGHQSVVRYH